MLRTIDRAEKIDRTNYLETFATSCNYSLWSESVDLYSTAALYAEYSAHKIVSFFAHLFSKWIIHTSTAISSFTIRPSSVIGYPETQTKLYLNRRSRPFLFQPLLVFSKTITAISLPHNRRSARTRISGLLFAICRLILSRQRQDTDTDKWWPYTLPNWIEHNIFRTICHHRKSSP